MNVKIPRFFRKRNKSAIFKTRRRFQNGSVTVEKSGTEKDYEEMVLSTVFPSGWEILNKRFERYSAKPKFNFRLPGYSRRQGLHLFRPENE
jgi:hypothetical protein